jgi:hypothetical protein
VNSETVKCRGCEATFERPIGTKGNPRQWCSERCRVWCHNHPGQERPLRKFCAWCGNPVPSDRRGAKYCQHACMLSAHGKLAVATRLALRQRGKANA